MSLVSIIIPYFKKKNYIRTTIKSILSQKYKKFEVIIIYDDSDRSELKYLKKIKSLDKRIRIIVNKKNIGAGPSRNRGLKHCRGSYIAFIDADDVWKPNKLKKQIHYMKKNNIMISHTSFEVINLNNHKILYRNARDLDYKDLLNSCDVGLSTVILKKKILKKSCFANLKTKEDYILWLKLSKQGYKFYALKKNYTSWRKTPRSLSSSILQRLHDGYKVYRVYLGYSAIISFIKLIVLSFNYLKK
jgi:teichuronic acid biosynthesis glycosyltransferase TuaG